jgi:symplekin
MELAYAADMEERRQRRANLASGKHPLEADAESSTAKRARLDVHPGSGDGKGRVMVDVSQFALEPVIDVVMRGLEVISDEMLARAFDNARQAIQSNDPDAVPVLAPCLLGEDVKLEEDVVLDPLAMELDDDELLMEPLEGELEEQVTITDFRLPPPEPLPLDEKTEIADSAVQRIWDTGSDLSHLADLKLSDAPRTAVQPKEMWMLLLARISSRGGDDKRRLIGEFVARDFGARSKFATVWLNEEWLAKRRSEKNQYEAGLLAILHAYIPTLDAKDQSLARFLVGLPELPEAAIDLLEPLCEDPDRMIVGFLSLRELAEHRPPVRPRALQTLLQLCTHPERKVRVMAITTVRRWVPNSPMSPSVISFALGVLRRLAVRAHLAVKEENGDAEKADEEMPADGEKPADADGAKPADADGDQAMEDGDKPAEDGDIGETIDTKYLGPVDEDTVSQHVELAFALSRRDPELLDAIFSIYPKIPPPIQAKVEELLAPLIKSLGPSKKLLEILKAFPPGAEPLALRVVKTLSAEGSSGVLVPVIRSLLAERELDPRFVIPVIGELDKAEIDAQIPRIVSLLSQPDSRDVVRTAFASALQKMTPADLLVTLHSEKAGLKPTMDAIGICFSMTTVFRSDVLANAMQRIVDQPSPLPVCFVRTVIQAMRTYKSLVPFIANNVLPKLVAKKIWEMPQLWDGFVHLVRLLGQASFGTLLQMPLEQIRDLVERQPALKAPLKTFVSNKPQARNQLASVLAD